MIAKYCKNYVLKTACCFIMDIFLRIGESRYQLQTYIVRERKSYYLYKCIVLSRNFIEMRSLEKVLISEFEK